MLILLNIQIMGYIGAYFLECDLNFNQTFASTPICIETNTSSEGKF